MSDGAKPKTPEPRGRFIALVLVSTALCSCSIAQTVASKNPAFLSEKVLASASWDSFDRVGFQTVTDSAGNIYAPVTGFVAAWDPAGNLIYRTALSAGGPAIAAAGNGSVWVGGDGGGLTKLDAAGKVVLALNFSTYLVATDPLGNLFVTGTNWDTRQAGLFKLDPQGKVVAFQAEVYGQAMAVGADGAVYLTGQALPFRTTQGAVVFGTGGTNVAKLSADLSQVIYAGTLGGLTPSAIGVDLSGSVYLSGVGQLPPAPQAFAFDVRLLGPIAAPGDSSQGVVVKIDPTGSELIFASGVGTYHAGGLAVDPTGRSYVLGYQRNQPMLVALDPSGSLLWAKCLAGLLTLYNNGLSSGSVAVRPDGGAIVIGNVNSTRYPIQLNERAPEVPIIFSIPPDPPIASVSLRVDNADQIAYRMNLAVVVRNDGPADAEEVVVTVPTSGPGFCFADGMIICQGGFGETRAIIPKIPAGTELRIRFQAAFPYFYDQPMASLQLGLSSFSAQARISGNIVPLTIPYGDDRQVFLGTYPGLFTYFRSDVGTLQFLYSPSTTATNMTVTIPSPQRLGGHVWTFGQWGDGSQSTQRTFDTSTSGVNADLGVLTFQPTTPIFFSPEALDFVAPEGGSRVGIRFQIQPPDVRRYPYEIDAPAASWLTLDRLTGTTNDGTTDFISATADPTGLSPETYSTSLNVTVSRPGGSDRMQYPVTLRVTDPAVPAQISSVANAASQLAGPIARGEIISIAGQGLGPDTEICAASVEAGPFVYLLGGTAVLLNGNAAPLLCVSATRILAIASPPNGVDSISVQESGQIVATLAVTSGEPSPGIFTADRSGSGNAEALNADGTPNSPSNPASRGTVLSLFVTGHIGADGGGGILPCSVNGGPPAMSAWPARNSLGMVAEIGGTPARILFAGSPAESVCGRQRVDLLVPDKCITGDAVPVSIWSDYKHPAQSGVTLAVQ